MPIKGFPKYEVSSLGRVKSFKRFPAQILKPVHTQTGYRQVSLCRDRSSNRHDFHVHRLVLTAFYGP